MPTIPAAGRVRILDAAETLFAANGFDGTSMRDITRRAGVEVGLATYHFRSKADLFRETMLRRAPAFAARLEAKLAAVDAPDPGAILAAYIDAHTTLRRSPDPGWRAYLQLAVEAMLRTGREGDADGATAIYRPVLQRYERALAEAAPAIDGGELGRVWTIFQRALLGALIASPTLAPDEDRLDALRRTFLAIFAGFLTAGR